MQTLSRLLNKSFFNFCLIAFGITNGYSQTYEWTRPGGGDNTENAHEVVVDGEGNSIYIGHYTLFTQLVGIEDTLYLDTVQNPHTSFICKYNPEGEILWARSFNSGHMSFIEDLYVDSNSNIMLIGQFYESVDLDPGPLEQIISPESGTGIFVVNLSSNGDLIWSQHIESNDYANYLQIKPSGEDHYVISGSFISWIDFDSGPDEFVLNVGFSAYSLFAAKYSLSGQFLWAKKVSGQSAIYVQGLDVDSDQNTYIAGMFYGNIDFDPSNESNVAFGVGESEAFVLKLSPNGDYVWHKTISGTGRDEITAFDLTSSGNIVIAGVYTLNVDMDPGESESIMQSQYGTDGFVAKWSEDGDFIWAKKLEGPIDEILTDFAVDPYDNIYVVGSFGISMDADPSDESVMLESSPYLSMFCVKLNSWGEYMWSDNFGESAYQNISSVSTHSDGSVYMVGHFAESIDFDPTSGVDEIESNGNQDSFLRKIFFCTIVTENSVIATCEPYLLPNGQLVEESGLYTILVGQSQYCDSLMLVEVNQNYVYFIVQPTDVTSEIGTDVTFSIVSNQECLYQWQVDVGDGAFIDVYDGVQFEGATTAQLSINDLLLANDNAQYRCILNLGECSDTSEVVVLNVLQLNIAENFIPEDFVFSLSNDHLIVKMLSRQNLTTIKIFSAEGRLQYYQEVDTWSYSIPIYQFTSGMYILSVADHGSSRFIIP